MSSKAAPRKESRALYRRCLPYLRDDDIRLDELVYPNNNNTNLLTQLSTALEIDVQPVTGASFGRQQIASRLSTRTSSPVSRSGLGR
jgi:hypothetical protein